MTNINSITRTTALSLSVAALALIVSAGAGHAQGLLADSLRNKSVIAPKSERAIQVEAAGKANEGQQKTTGNVITLPPKAAPAGNTGGNSGGIGQVQFVPPKTAPVATQPAPSGQATAKFVPPKTAPVATAPATGGQVVRFEAPKAPRVNAAPAVQLASLNGGGAPAQAQVVQQAQVDENETDETEAAPQVQAPVETAPAAKAPEGHAAPQQRVLVKTPYGYFYVTAPTYHAPQYAPRYAPQYAPSHVAQKGYSYGGYRNCR